MNSDTPFGLWLILESSGRAGRIGVAINGMVVARATLDEARRHARDLAATVQRLLSEVGRSPKELTGIMVSIGPGSFTGLRVGITSAKALAYAVGCPLIAVPTFPSIASLSPFETVDVISDGLQQHVYRQRFVRGVAVNEMKIEAVSEWITSLSAEVAVSGPGVSVYDSQIPSDCPRVDESQRMPTIESILAVGQVLTPLTRHELFSLEPLYLRGSSAEEKAKTMTSSSL